MNKSGDLSQIYFITLEMLLLFCVTFSSLYLFFTSFFLLLLPLFEHHFIVIWDHGIIFILNLHS